MNRRPPFARLFPKTFHSHCFLYNILVILLSCGIGILSFAVLSLLAMFGSFALSEHLSAGMAGMSLILIFQVLAALVALGIALFLLIWNIRKS